MTFTVDLRPEIETRLAAIAAERRMSLAQYASHVLEAQLPEEKPRSPAERAAPWLEHARNVPPTPTLSDEALSRETIYDTRGSARLSTPTSCCGGGSVTTLPMTSLSRAAPRC